MKRILLTLSLFAAVNFCSAQTVNEKPVRSIASQYIVVNTSPKGNSSYKRVIHLDYGQGGSSHSKESLVKAIGGDAPIVFASDAAALNFMYKMGYKLFKVIEIKGTDHSFLFERMESKK